MTEVDVFERIKKILELKKIPLVRMVKAVGLSEQGYYKMARSGSIKIPTLYKILNFLRVDYNTFFSNSFIDDLLNENVTDKHQSSAIQYSKVNIETKNALIEKDLKMMESLIKSIRETIGT